MLIVPAVKPVRIQDRYRHLFSPDRLVLRPCGVLIKRYL
jgi:hypothetical protein